MSASVQSGTHSHPTDQDSAASAALRVARDNSSSQTSSSVLDADGRLSAASAATSLKYARAQDLPSFPSQGGVKLASAGAAASLANDNQKPFEHWKPDAIPAANKAALQAKDYKMNPLWQPELSAAGSKAALQAHQNTTSPSIWKASESEHGLSAAGQAHASRKSPNAITERDVSASDHRKALLAATGAMSGNRKRSGSAPTAPQTNATSAWALKAANSTRMTANPRGEFASGDPGFEAARVQNIAKNNVSRQMYTSAPPVSIEVEEKNRQDTLRASAVAMAQRMYAIQQSHIDAAKGTNKVSDSTSGARAARNRAMSDASSSYGSTEAPGRGYENLQEAATRLAQEKLAKLHDEHAEYRSYYGQTSQQPRGKLSMRQRRRRASSRDDDSDSDEEQSRKIRSQMSLFQSKLAEVDSKKRQADRDALLQAAHKNVTSQLNKMDEKIFSETGKSSPQQRELWERQARERAQRDSDARMINAGRVHVGGGKYFDQSEIDAIAKARLQPTLDDIADKAEKQRARDEEIRLEQERVKAEQEKEKLRQAEIKRDLKEAENREKQRQRDIRAEEKRVQRETNDAEKEKARVEKAEKRQSEGRKPGFFGKLGRGAGDVAVGTAAGAAVSSAGHGSGQAAQEAAEGTEAAVRDAAEPSSPEVERPRTSDSLSSDSPRVTSPTTDDPPRPSEPVTTTAEHETAASPTKRDSKMKSFFGRLRGKSQSAADADDTTQTATAGNVLTKTSTDSADKDKDMPRSDSMRDVALAGRTKSRDSETSDMYGDATEHQEASSPSPVATESKPIVTTTNTINHAPLISAATTVPRSRSPSISSLSSSAHSDTHPTAATTTDPAPKTAAAAATTTTTTTTSTSPSPTPVTDSTPKTGLRARLLKKVKPSSKTNTNNISAESPTVPRPAVSTNASEWGVETEGALAAPKESQDTEEREEARDSFREERLGSKDGGAGTEKGGKVDGSRFREDL